MEEKRASNMVRKRRVLEVTEVRSVCAMEGVLEELEHRRGVKRAGRNMVDGSEEEWEKLSS